MNEEKPIVTREAAIDRILEILRSAHERQRGTTRCRWIAARLEYRRANSAWILCNKRGIAMASELIDEGGRLIGSRINVYNLLPDLLDPESTEAYVAKVYSLTP